MTAWSDPIGQRPTKADFDPADGDLDALIAWKNFGGLSRPEAYKKFCEFPETYQEDFFFMGGVAFLYYFPVLEKYILESRVENDNDVEAMWILAYCMKSHFEAWHIDYELRARILSLASHVRNNLGQYCIEQDEQGRIDTAWQELEFTLRAGHRAN